MVEYKLGWYSNDGTGETVALESDSVSPDRFWDVWSDALHRLFNANPEFEVETHKLTRDQFRRVVKALTDGGSFRPAAPREVVSIEFTSGKGWVEKEG